MPRSNASDDEYEPSPGRDAQQSDRVIQNMPYDEALELSQESEASSLADGKPSPKPYAGAKGDAGAKSVTRSSPPKGNRVMHNNPFDEACDLEDSENSVLTTEEAPSPKRPQPSAFVKQHLSPDQPERPLAARPSPKQKSPQAGLGMMKPSPKQSMTMQSSSDEEDDDEEDDDEEDDEPATKQPPSEIEGAYNAEDYADLNVSADVRDLFQYIGRYAAHEVELESTLKCFVPDYIPAVGEMDAFLKVPRPDDRADLLGLQVLDEPAAAQSDATVLELQLRAVSKKQHGDVAVRSIENAAKNPQEIDRWIKSIEDLHRSKPPPQVHYRKAMPDIDALMEEWEPEFEELLKTTPLPDEHLEGTIAEFAKIACGLLDVPVYDSIVESLHVLFSVYLEFTENVHFQQQVPAETAQVMTN